jgi:HlyD family secretion protein
MNRAKAMAYAPWAAIALGLAVLAGSLVAGRTHAQDVRQPQVAAPVRAAVGVGALGRIEPASRVRRLATGAGPEGARVARLLVSEGDRVATGQLLAEFHDLPKKEATLAQAAANLALAEAQLARLLAAGRDTDIAAARARVAAAQAAEQSAAREAARAERLRGTPAGNEATFDRTRFAAAQASAERARAEAELRTLLSPREEDIAVSRAQVDAARAQVAQATADRDLSRLVAPIAGSVLRIMARPGEKVPDDGVMELADLSALQVVAEVYETDLPRVREGLAAEVIVPGEPRPFAARVAQVGWTVRRNAIAGTDPVAAIDARVVEVRLDLDPAAIPRLERRTNMQVQVRIAAPTS